jgi:hypothetical protein
MLGFIEKINGIWHNFANSKKSLWGKKLFELLIKL